MVAVELGHTDTDYTACLNVPSVGLVVAGDAAYNDIHLYLAESNAQTRQEWIAALDKIESLNPRAVVASHKRPENDDDPGIIEQSLAPYSLQGSTLTVALGPGTKLQMIAVDDIGWFGARAFTDAAALSRREIDLAGDIRTMPEAAEILTEALGRPIAFVQTPIEQVRQYSKDMALMLEWFERVGYSADIAGLERQFCRTLTKLSDWARRHARPIGR